VPDVGPAEILLLVLVALLIFGPKRLPEIGRSIGEGMREFKDSIAGDREPGSSPGPSADEGSSDEDAAAVSEPGRDDGS
jgi:sec-independent protein translocase protein TatA